MNDNLLPAEVHMLLQRAFPSAVIGEPAPTSGGYSHRSAFVTVGGQPVVVKSADQPERRADLRREARVLALLQPQRLPVPELLHLLEGDHWTALLTRRVPGDPGQWLYEQPPAQIAPIYRALGAILAAIHTTTPLAQPEIERDLAARHSRVGAALAGMALPADLLKPLRAALDTSRKLAATPQLTHGDPGLHNLIVAGDRLTLIDWEWAGWDHPLRDLAWLAWTLEFRRMPLMLWHAFLHGYGEQGPVALDPDRTTLHQLALAQIAAILQRCPPGSPAQAEWLRRTRWTLELDFGRYAGPAAGP